MNKYQDDKGLWHDDLELDSNNVFIYGAYGHLLNLDTSSYCEYFEKCKISVSRNNIIIHRHPNKPEPPLSHDEILGMYMLGLVSYDVLKGNHFVFYGHGKRLDSKMFERLAKGLMELVMAHNINIFMPKSKKVKQRNLWWEKNLQNVKYFASRLTPAYTYMVKRIAGRKPHEEERVLWKFYYENLLKNKKTDTSTLSQKNLMWALLVADGDESRARKLNPVRNFELYFGSEHPFTIAMKKRYA